MVWDVKKLGEVCSFTRGLTYKKSDESSTGSIKVLRANNIEVTDGRLNFNEIKRLRDEVIVPKEKIVEKNSLIICTASGSKTHLGKIGFIDQDYGMAFGGFMGLLRPKPQIYAKYLFRVMQSKAYKDFINSLADGANINNLRFNQLSEFKVSITSYEEQKRIVAILDKAFEQINHAKANAEQNLKNAREVFKGALHKILSDIQSNYKAIPLTELAEISSGGTPTKSNKQFWDGEIAWYSSGELNLLQTVDPKEYITELGLNSSNAKLFPKGSLLIGMYDTAALKMSILDRNGTFNQAIAGVKPNENINLNYVRFFIDFIKPEILAQRRGVRQKNLNQSKIKAIPISLPSLEIQKQVVDSLFEIKNQTESLESIYQHKIKALDELKQSLLQKAFSGELTKSADGDAA